MWSLALIYGEQIIDDFQFCAKHEAVIKKYEHGLMTLQGAPTQTLRSIAKNPSNVPGWESSIKEFPTDGQVLAEFLIRMANHFEKNRKANKEDL